MLDINVFEEGLDEIEGTYLAKKFTVKYNDLYYKTWYKHLQGLTNEQYLDAIDNWCATNSSLPTPADILTNAGKLRTTVDNTVQIPQNKEYCRYCKNTGLISFKYKHSKLNKIYEQVVCCICDAGEYCKSIYQLPQLNRAKLDLVVEPPKPKIENKDIESITTNLAHQMSITEDKE